MHCLQYMNNYMCIHTLLDIRYQNCKNSQQVREIGNIFVQMRKTRKNGRFCSDCYRLIANLKIQY